jgi:hypothetical protein
MISDKALEYYRKRASVAKRFENIKDYWIKPESILKMLDYIEYLEKENARLRRSI